VSEFPEKIEGRINAIINQQYKGEQEQSFEIFSTPKSKIFVLQNMQDIFEFKKGNEFKNFNLVVYEICTKKINELERMEISVDDALIDKAQDDYKKQFGISTSTLKNISSAEVDKKIDEVKEAMNVLVKGLVDNKVKIDRNVDAYFRALVSILTHLYYKQSEKQKMFIGQELLVKGALFERKKGYVEQMKKDFAEGERVITPATVTKESREETLTALQEKYPQLKLERAKARAAEKGIIPLKWTPEELAQRAATQEKSRAQQPSLFSRVRSAWNSWWYGSK